ncbi:MAG: hypothetical protein IJ097_03095 [Bacilli bacterium]|nr:hypothetical protein [Bacilli bacterium]
MEKLDDKKLDNIKGGNTSISGPIINALVNIINVLKDAGYALGSGIRRVAEDELCPLK